LKKKKKEEEEEGWKGQSLSVFLVWDGMGWESGRRRVFLFEFLECSGNLLDFEDEVTTRAVTSWFDPHNKTRPRIRRCCSNTNVPDPTWVVPSDRVRWCNEVAGWPVLSSFVPFFSPSLFSSSLLFSLSSLLPSPSFFHQSFIKLEIFCWGVAASQ